jgi:ABC-type dipeptide/oligopeptide/nickel transport system ATPase component
LQLSIRNLSIDYRTGRGTVSAVRDVSVDLEEGHTLGIVGESGSGKSTLGLALIRLLPKNASTSGQILLGDDDVLTLPESKMRRIRGPVVGMVFQDSLASLNPSFTVGGQLMETLRVHNKDMTRHEAQARAAELFGELSIPPQRLRSYPHELSGGMRQRAMIAIALSCHPRFLIADEATSDLDTVSQRLILDMLSRIQEERGLGMVVVSHDLGVVRHLCESVAVMYRGDLVEYGPTAEVLNDPQHWYTQGLIRVSAKRRDAAGRLYTLPKAGEKSPQAATVEVAQ